MCKFLCSVFLFIVPSFVFASDSVDIRQLPSGSKPVGGENETVQIKIRERVSDYQSQILDNPSINERARAREMIHKNRFNGNAATVIQNGSSNSSTVIQSGENNYSIQNQVGEGNDIYVDQSGENNYSAEEQDGDYSHKIIIQNGKKTEEFNKKNKK
ncbi:MAG: hypothetical protein R3D71_05575 [Rickettsiales bacterium]